jgi:hypothetical protein
VKVSAAKEKNKQVELFEMPLFSNEWFADTDVGTQDDIPTFTF